MVHLSQLSNNTKAALGVAAATGLAVAGGAAVVARLSAWDPFGPNPAPKGGGGGTTYVPADPGPADVAVPRPTTSAPPVEAGEPQPETEAEPEPTAGVEVTPGPTTTPTPTPPASPTPAPTAPANPTPDAAEATGTTKPAEPTGSAKPTKPTEPSGPADPPDPAGPADPPDPADPVSPSELAQLAFSKERPLPDGATAPAGEDLLQFLPQGYAPAGLEVSLSGYAEHRVSEGETLVTIAQQYADFAHATMTATELARANDLDPAERPEPGFILQLPVAVSDRVGKLATGNPGLVSIDGELRHQVGQGETLSSIARGYNQQFGLAVSAGAIAKANPDALADGAPIDESVAPLSIPGLETTRLDVEPPPPPAIEEFAGVEVLTRRSDVSFEGGRRGTIDVLHGRLETDRAKRIGTSLSDAVRAARTATAGSTTGGSPQAAVVQAADGYYLVPVAFEEDPGLDDSTRVDRTYMDQSNPFVRAYAQAEPNAENLELVTWPA